MGLLSNPVLNLTILVVFFVSFNPASSATDTLDNAKITEAPIVLCSTKWVTVHIKTSVPFQGRIFVEGRAYDSRCSAQYTSNLASNATFRFLMNPCGKTDHTRRYGKQAVSVANIKINFHPIIIMQNSRVFKVVCEDPDSNSLLHADPKTNRVCRHSITNLKPDAGQITVGDIIRHRWVCSPDFEIAKHAIMLRKCDVTSRSGEIIHLIDENGCAIDDLLLFNVRYNRSNLEVTADTKVFTFVDENELRFSCRITLIQRTADYAPFILPKCSISRDELRKRHGKQTALAYFENGDQTYRDFNAIMNGTEALEAPTKSEWIYVRSHNPKQPPATETVIIGRVNNFTIDGSFFGEKLRGTKGNRPSLATTSKPDPRVKPQDVNHVNDLLELYPDKQQLGRFSEIGRGGVNFEDLTDIGREPLVLPTPKSTTTRRPKTTTPKVITTTTPWLPEEMDVEEENIHFSAEDVDEDKFNLKKIESLLLGNKPVPGTINRDVQTGETVPLSITQSSHEIVKADWRLDDVILNATDELITRCTSEVARLNASVGGNLPNTATTCSWRSINIVLLISTALSIVLWIILIAHKAYQFLCKRERKKAGSVSSDPLSNRVPLPYPPYPGSAAAFHPPQPPANFHNQGRSYHSEFNSAMFT